LPRHGRCRLKRDAVDHLDQVCPDVLHALPGYQPPTSPGPRHRRLYDREAKHSEQLHALIDQSVFQRFRFIFPAA
jgi:hypothetical protein